MTDVFKKDQYTIHKKVGQNRAKDWRGNWR